MCRYRRCQHADTHGCEEHRGGKNPTAVLGVEGDASDCSNQHRHDRGSLPTDVVGHPATDDDPGRAETAEDHQQEASRGGFPTQVVDETLHDECGCR